MGRDGFFAGCGGLVGGGFEVGGLGGRIKVRVSLLRGQS